MLRVTEYFANSLNVIQNGTIRKLEYGFLFACHSNYGSISYHFGDKVTYLSKIAIFHTPVCVRGSRQQGPRRTIVKAFGGEKLEWCGNSTLEKVWWYV